MVTLYRRTTRGEVITAQGVTDASGAYVIRRRFLGGGRWSFVARTGNGLVAVAGNGPVRSITLR